MTDLMLQPIQVGPMLVRNRVVHPPHSMGIGRLLGSERQAQLNRDYWQAKAAQGPGWVVPISGVVDVPLIAGFEPVGVGAVTRGLFRHPKFHERTSALATVIHEHGTYAICQLVLSGGLPHGPSDIGLSGMTSSPPHPMGVDEIKAAQDEFVFGAVEAQRAGLDGIEMHACHDDLVEWFLSPQINHRDDEYGVDTQGRTRMLREIVGAIRAACGPDFAIGVRLEVDQGMPGGYGVDEAVRIAELLHADGNTDYLSWVYGSNWAEHSYMPTPELDEAPWSHLVARVRAAVPMPMVYTGRVRDAASIDQVLRDGHADLVGVARAAIADPQFLLKITTGRSAELRPCIGCNDCLHRPLFDGLPTTCAINPYLLERPRAARPAVPRRVVVAGAGPAGMEAAALLAEDGYDVTLVEVGDALGGQLVLSARILDHRDQAGFIAFQQARLARLGVSVELNRRLSADDVRDLGADLVVLATGSVPRRPAITGIDAPWVLDSRTALLDESAVGERVVVVAEDDSIEPISVAAHLARAGRRVDLVYRAREVASAVGRYSFGARLAAVARAGGECHVLQRVVEVTQHEVRIRSVFGEGERDLNGIDTVVLACGAVPNVELGSALAAAGVEHSIIGDCYAPRGIGAATSQAAALVDGMKRIALAEHS